MHRVAILNSRQTKTPVAHDPWVLGTLAAVDHVAGAGNDVISSIGMTTWDLVTWRTGLVEGPIELVMPIADSSDEEETKASVLREFNLSPTNTRWRFFAAPSAELTKKSWWPQRDETVIGSADMIVPVSIRSGGLLEKLISQRGLDTNLRFQTEYRPYPHHVRQLIDPSRLDPAIETWPDDYLIHWTRASNGPWPGETKASYFADVLLAKDQYCRSAAATLERILQEGIIRGSQWRIAGGQPVVSFTELSPLDSLSLMRWRARWARWTFEPYGIAVHRDWAASQDVRPVRYVTDKEWRTLAPEEKPRCHRIGKMSGEWPAEREWRCHGDFPLLDAPSGAIRLIVREYCEVEKTCGAHDVPTSWFMRAADAPGV
jgi:hypothetical protein